ncbi:methyltransferase domain-containing protein [Candidatus Falkowbacteria bacterium]|nr:methyltransferase domain-containing protein [Candidatus Falkowbacteria bacterium]
MAVNIKIYDQKFFNSALKLENSSAKEFTAILIKHFWPKSVIDIGCGIGVYLAEFKANNIKIIGFDGSPAAIIGSLAGDKIKLHDLCRPLKLSSKFDLCLCLEVAEHLEKNCAQTLISTLTGLSSTIICTAATPGQGPLSIGHINEQPPEYWQKLFGQKNFKLDKELTKKIKREMKKKKIIWWLTKNLMIFKKHEK